MSSYTESEGPFNSVDVDTQTKPQRDILLFDNLYNLYKEGFLTDLEIKTHDKNFNVHSVVAAINSEYILATLRYNKKPEKIELPNIRSEIFEIIAEFIYLRDVKIPEELLVEIFEASNFLLINQLIQKCASEASDIIHKAQDLNTIIGFTKLLTMYQDVTIRQAFDDKINQNFSIYCKLLNYYNEECLVDHFKRFSAIEVEGRIFFGKSYLDAIKRTILANFDDPKKIIEYFEREIEERKKTDSEIFSGYPTCLLKERKQLANHPLWAYDYEHIKSYTLEPPDYKLWRIKKLIFYSINNWDGHGVMCSGVGVVYEHFDTGELIEQIPEEFDSQEKVEFTFQDDEFITDISVSAGWMIDWIKVYTNLDRMTGAGSNNREDFQKVSTQDPGEFSVKSDHSTQKPYLPVSLIGFTFNVIKTHDYITWNKIHFIFNGIRL